jgi:HAD superfamily hydrolase (TIGR01509 family)
MMIKALIFDCFGVLVTDGLGRIVSERGLSDEEVDQVVKLVTATNRGEITPDVYRASIAKKLNLTVEGYINKIRNNEVKNIALLEYIRKLKAQFKTGLLSNVSGRQSLERRFDNNELSKTFDVVVASGDIGFAKPEAQAYEITADQLGVLLTECIMIDDREDYCQGARGVGMQTILYRSFEQMQNELSGLI